MKTLTKREQQIFNKLESLIIEFGYWSNEVREFNSTLNYKTMNKINLHSHATTKQRSPLLFR